jgi:Glycosyltransferase family 87
MALDLYYAMLLMKATAFLMAVALIFRARLKPIHVWVVALGTAAFVLTILYLLFSALGFDYRIFWTIGRGLWSGKDPYAADYFVIYPPTALPVFAALALLPFEWSFLVWTILNLLACMALVPFAHSVLVSEDRLGGLPTGESEVRWRLPGLVMVGLSAALLIADAPLVTFYLGQFSIIEAVLLLTALGAQARGRPAWAGALLALATIKVATMLPFLLLFLRKTDRWAWLSLLGTTLGLCLLSGRLGDLQGDVVSLRERIKEVGAPGTVNDYSFEGTRHENIMGFEHAFYRIGLRDRGMIRLAQYAALLLLGAWVARQVVPERRLTRAAACSLVALYSAIFLYHRSYDAVILVLPLVYCAGQARVAQGRTRYLFAACAVSVLAVLHLNIDLLRAMTSLSFESGPVWGRVLQGVVLPYGTWLIVLAMVLLVKGTRASLTEAAPSLPHPTEVAT